MEEDNKEKEIKEGTAAGGEAKSRESEFDAGAVADEVTEAGEAAEFDEGIAAGERAELTAEAEAGAGVGQKKKRDRRFAKGLVIGIVCTLAVLIIAGLGIFLLGPGRYLVRTSGGSGMDLTEVKSKLTTLDAMVENYYLYIDDVDAEAMADGVYKGFMGSLGDPYSVYYTADEYDSMLENSNGAYVGIGVYLRQDADYTITVIEVFAGSGAEEAGLMPDDILYKVDGEDITEDELDYVVSKIKGDDGTYVTLEVYRPIDDAYVTIEIERRTVEVSTVIHSMLDDDIGYIDIVEFDSVTYDQFMEALDELKDAGMAGLILDLRSNPGGLLDVCVDISDALLSEGTIVSTTSSLGQNSVYEADEDISYDGPIVVLADGNSASAAEILTAALKDNGRATVVGTTTYGKGIVQSIFSLGDGTAVKITTADYYTPNGVSIHGVGIDPDVEVEVDVSVEDNQLDAAKEILEDMIGR